MARFVVQERTRMMGTTTEYVVADLQDEARPVATFRDRAAAEAHAQKLEAGPLDWDEQEAWQDDDDDDDAW